MSKKSKKYRTEVMTVHQKDCNLKNTVKVIPEPERKVTFLKSPKIFDDEPRLIEYDKYSKPVINSTLRLAKAMLDEERKAKQMKTIQSLDDLTPYEQKIILKQIAKNLNVPQEVCIFKDLIPLEVNIDDVMKHSTYRTASKSSSRREFTKKDIEPKLSDFYRPKKRQEYKVIVDLPNVNSKSIQSFDGLSLSQKISSWSMD